MSSGSRSRNNSWPGTIGRMRVRRWSRSAHDEFWATHDPPSGEDQRRGTDCREIDSPDRLPVVLFSMETVTHSTIHDRKRTLPNSQKTAQIFTLCQCQKGKLPEQIDRNILATSSDCGRAATPPVVLFQRPGMHRLPAAISWFYKKPCHCQSSSPPREKRRQHNSQLLESHTRTTI